MEKIRKSASNGMKILTVLIIAWILEIFFFAWCLLGSEVKVTWQYPPHASNIVFQVFSTTNGQRGDLVMYQGSPQQEVLKGQGMITNATGFLLFATTADTFLIASNSDPQRFFAVRAYDTVSKTNSAWATQK